MQAKARNLYDNLFKVELTAYLRDYTAASRISITSADTLVYFGPLEDVVHAGGRRAAARAAGSSSRSRNWIGDSECRLPPCARAAATRTLAAMSNAFLPRRDSFAAHHHRAS